MAPIRACLTCMPTFQAMMALNDASIGRFGLKQSRKAQSPNRGTSLPSRRFDCLFLYLNVVLCRMNTEQGDAATPMDCDEPLPGPSSGVPSAAAAGDNVAPATRFEAKCILGEHKKAVSSIKFSRDGRKLATACKWSTVS